MAELINRGAGLMATSAAADEVTALLAEATRLAAGDPAAQARTLTAMAFSYDDADPAAVDLIERATTLARRARDPLTESAALDHLTAFQLARGELRAAAASASRRTELLAPLRATRGGDGVLRRLQHGRGVRHGRWRSSQIHVGEFFDALLLLHQGHPQRALRLLRTPPEEFRTWYSGMWRPWYAAMWAEAAVLTGHRDTNGRIRRARQMAQGNPIATAIVDRAAALAGDRSVASAATALAAAGCRYQWARTLILAGGAQRARGESVLAEMGATPMVWPAKQG